jgi:hypothetical protein
MTEAETETERRTQSRPEKKKQTDSQTESFNDRETVHQGQVNEGKKEKLIDLKYFLYQT